MLTPSATPFAASDGVQPQQRRYRLLTPIVLSPLWEEGSACLLPARLETLCLSRMAARILHELDDSGTLGHGELLTRLDADGTLARNSTFDSELEETLAALRDLRLIAQLPA